MIRPCPGALTYARGKIPTPRGPILVDWKSGPPFQIAITLPDDVPAQVELPAGENSRGVYVDGNRADAHREASRWILDNDITGTVTIEVR